jgi:hypothetical protein
MTAILPYGDRAAREVSARAGGTYANAAAITALVAADRANGMIVANLATQMLWIYDAASAAAAGPGVLVPDDAPAAGRWLIHATGTGLAAGSVLVTHLDGEVALAGAGAVGTDGVPFVIYVPIVAGITGAADDVLVTDSVPTACRVIDVKAVVTTVGVGDTWTLRDAAGGGGAAITNAISVAVAGVIPWGVTAIPADLVAASDLYVRRSDDTTDGALIITCLPV